ncbi:group II intron reverse transcriptase/maturase [Clostridium sp. CX1]|uniref:group II intron reverse transcriptase/maturase n=1 Tax=Clostridium sp. CX1 TaxID=2978346 RepID=UPI0021C0E3C7|nr:group II intron reverse transcriptase/maturase [Clostridium sp. CX1]MCT8978869.1 group II intron reverse transcriptase/maturase [Clostridium sp. CX1]
MKHKKKQKLRNNEYYNNQAIYDDIYTKSLKGYKFKNLMDIVMTEENILLSYRNIKKNKGSKTAGINKNTIIEIGNSNPEELVEYVRNRLNNYEPQAIRRVEIEKESGGIRPLGISTIEDRLIQQCIKQVLEPICEAKFYKHSYGFRANRSTEHAIARAMKLINIAKLHYAVDIDIKAFFDNVNHEKLLKQMWTMGIQDKNLLSIISKALKAEVTGIGIPEKGTVQGGIISPLLSNIVLNELDWWVSSQWESFMTEHNYSSRNKYRAMKNTNLKEMFIVRYADDLKIFCRNHKTAQKALMAVKKWLKERLGLEINSEKSEVVNLRKNYSNFLGFKMKVINKGYKKVATSRVSDKARKKIINKIKEKIKAIQKNTKTDEVNKYNASILGMHNYYRNATQVSLAFYEIAFLVSKTLYNRTKKIRSETGLKSKAYLKYYGKYKYKTIYIAKVALFPIGGISTKDALHHVNGICNYTEEGRKKIHENLKGINKAILQYIMRNPVNGQSSEYNDNRISLYVAQYGKCSVTGETLKIGEMEAHHKKPKSLGGSDEYNNLTFVLSDVHKLIHAIADKTVKEYKEKLKLDKEGLEKLNKLRLKVGNCVI